MKKLIEGEDYYFNDGGKLVFTEKYHLKRGKCCQSGCKHCPYGYIKEMNEELSKAELLDVLIETAKEIGRLEESEAEGHANINSIGFANYKQKNIDKLSSLKRQLLKI